MPNSVNQTDSTQCYSFFTSFVSSFDVIIFIHVCELSFCILLKLSLICPKFSTTWPFSRIENTVYFPTARPLLLILLCIMTGRRKKLCFQPVKKGQVVENLGEMSDNLCNIYNPLWNI